MTEGTIWWACLWVTGESVHLSFKIKLDHVISCTSCFYESAFNCNINWRLNSIRRAEDMSSCLKFKGNVRALAETAWRSTLHMSAQSEITCTFQSRCIFRDKVWIRAMSGFPVLDACLPCQIKHVLAVYSTSQKGKRLRRISEIDIAAWPQSHT